jgi:hypothetical protein
MRAKTLALLPLLIMSPYAFAGSKPADQQQLTEEPQDAELLEFIAEFEPLDGQWVDPIQLNTIFAENRNGKEND